MGDVAASHLDETPSNEECPIFYIDQHAEPSEWSVDLVAHRHVLNFKIDTGAQCNVLLRREYLTLTPKPKVRTTKLKLTACNGSDIPVLGTCLVNVLLKNNSTGPLMFVIADTLSPPILGFRSCLKLNLIKRVMAIDNAPSSDSDIIEKYSDCFGDFGTVPREYHITLKENVDLVIMPPRKVPMALRTRLKAELDRMVQNDIIAPVQEPTDWVNSLVVVDKCNGKLRVCLDPRPLNKAIKREHFQLPTTEEILSQMSGARYFSKLDASQGYWHLRVDDESSKLLTFATPFGRFRYKRLHLPIYYLELMVLQILKMI